MAPPLVREEAAGGDDTVIPSNSVQSALKTHRDSSDWKRPQPDAVDNVVLKPVNEGKLEAPYDEEPVIGSSDTPDADSKNIELDSGGNNGGIEIERNGVLPIDSDTDSDSDEFPAEWIERRPVEIISKIKSEELFASYVAKLARKEQASKNKADKKSRGSKLVESMIDYVRILEDRLSKLESTVNKKDTDTDGKGKDEKDEARSEEASLDLDVAFFPNEDEFDKDGGYVEDNVAKPSKYTCRTDPKRLIRVLYDWKDISANHEGRMLKTGSPDPKHINVLAMGITSEPISSFLDHKLGSGLFPHTELSRFYKPFRPLIRNFGALKEHRAKLEGLFGNEEKSATEAEDLADDGKNETETVPKREETKNSEAPGKEKTPAFEEQRALKHFEIVVDFLEDYLGDQLSLFEKMKGTSENRVAFENLWMLFDSGDTLYCPTREAGRTELLDNDNEAVLDIVRNKKTTRQAYRVVATYSGGPKKRPLASKKGETQSSGAAVSPAVQTIQRARQRYASLFVLCYYIDYKGTSFGTVIDVFAFKPYEGEMDIRSLDAFPMRYQDASLSRVSKEQSGGKDQLTSGTETRTMDILLERGRRFIDLTKVSHMLFDGMTDGDNREEISSEMVIDIKVAYQWQQYHTGTLQPPPVFSPLDIFRGKYPPLGMTMHEHMETSCSDLWCHSVSCLSDRYITQQDEVSEEMEQKVRQLMEKIESLKVETREGRHNVKRCMEENDLISLLPAIVPGFVLRKRKWVQVDITLLEDTRQEDSWKDLVLPKGHKEMVQAMVETHARGSRSTSGQAEDHTEVDLVRGKGKGCIILLHGEPGVGKTSTAECVAAYTNRPLYPITCGDIGYTPEDVESNMERHFQFAHKWGCVLLLDEADVFLAKRNREDIKRNGLVSIFLRILEYYSGILFLTTNRVGTIDDAFRSRLHLTLYYPSLEKEQTMKIWRMNLRRMAAINEEREKNGRPMVEFNEWKILKWAKRNWVDLKWNGRQIRNAFQTAVALAEFKSRRLVLSDGPTIQKQTIGSVVMEVKHFSIIARASDEFNIYLLKTHGNEESQLAYKDRLRANPETMLKAAKSRFADEDTDSDSESDQSPDNDSSDNDTDASDSSSSDSDSSKKARKKKKSKTSKDEKKNKEKDSAKGKKKK